MTKPDLQSAILCTIADSSMVEVDGVRVCRVDAGVAINALTIITASIIAASPEAGTPDGVKRVLRRQARRLQAQITEFRRHAAMHGSPFRTEAGQ